MNLAINFFEIKVSKDQINIPYLNFNDREGLKELRDSNAKSILMHSNDSIFFWGENSLFEDGTKVLHKNKDGNLFSKALAESFLNQFYQNRDSFKIFKDFHTYNITFLDKDVSNGQFQGLKLYKRYSLHFGPLRLDSGIKLGFTISTSISEKISWSIQDFAKARVHYEDLLCDIDTGNISINAKSKYRLAHHFNYASRLKDELDKQNAIQNEFEEINNFVETYFRSKMEDFILPDELQIHSIDKIVAKLGNRHGNIKNEILQRPECYFYGGKFYEKDIVNRLKIKYNKPFSYDEFENRKIKISIIFPESFYQSTFNFIRNVKNELFVTFGIKDDFIEAVGKKIPDFSLNSYIESFPKIKAADIVIVVVDKSHESLKVNESPYFICKSEFMKRGIPTQEVQIQKIEKYLSDKKSKSANYTDHNIALNIYAKLGGVAWTIKPNETKNELILGIGATTDRNGKPVLGLTSIFRGDGKYLLGYISSVTGMADYKENLEEIISKALENNIEQGILDPQKQILLIFHIFKTAGKNNEIEALENVISKLSNYTFVYSFIHIGYGHNYRFFTYSHRNNQPIFERRKGAGQNIRGTFIRINNRLGFLGLGPYSSTFHKMEIHHSSTFQNLEYLANQVYQFAEMSHKSYNKSSYPITIKYPSLMAYLAEKLKKVEGFRLNNINMEDNSLWFI